jgi:hypothetical protein
MLLFMLGYDKIVRTGVFQSFLPNGRWCVSQDPFPSPAFDGEEPDGCVPPPGSGTGQDAVQWADDDRDGAGQGTTREGPAGLARLAAADLPGRTRGLGRTRGRGWRRW